MILINILNSAERTLTAAGVDTPRLDAEVLLAHLLKLQRVDLYMKREVPIDEKTASGYEEMIGRRAAGCPVAYITGVREFWSIPIKVTKDVLIPRPETELLVERTLAIIRSVPESRVPSPELRVLDLGTGSGCIAAALATELPNARFTVTDVSEAAVDVARTNLEFASGRVEFLCGSLFEALGSRFTVHGSRFTDSESRVPSPESRKVFDIITTNPPYVPTGHRNMLGKEITDHEPEVSLYGGKSGLDFAAKIIEDAPRFLKPDGWLIMEMGLGQAEKLETIAEQCGGWDDVVITKDLADIERVISLQHS